MNAIILVAAIAANPVGTLTMYADCYRPSDLADQGLTAAGIFEGGGGERYQLWIGGGRIVVTMTAPVVRNAVCVVVDAKELPEI